MKNGRKERTAAGEHLRSMGTVDRQLPVGDGAAILILVMFVLFVLSVPKFDLAGVIPFAAFPLYFITSVGIPAKPLLKRIALVSPFLLFMAAGNLVLDRQPALTANGLILTRGMISASVILLKTVLTLSALLSLISCMPFHRFGTALRSLRVPEVFVTQLLLVYRYSILLAEEAGMMQKARDLRSFGAKGTGAVVTAKLIGSLLLRTTARAERIYMAMDARGFRVGLDSARPRALIMNDVPVLAGSLLMFLSVRHFF
jgi:cobalt/nickel transport system permease protein